MEKEEYFSEERLKRHRMASEMEEDHSVPLLVRDDKIISEAFNRVVLNNDPTAHAEILAIRQASSILNSHDLSGCTSIFFM